MTDLDFLRGKNRPDPILGKSTMSVADLFCGCGGLSLGLGEAARRAGVGLEIPIAVDLDPVMARTFLRNNPGAGAIAASVESLFSGGPGEELAGHEIALRDRIAPIDILVGGPPCQGHSDLNNHTRRADDRNRLYLRMARAAEVLLPKAVLIENVPAVRRDKGRVVQQTRSELEKLSYQVHDQVVDLVQVGVPQHRKRHLMLGIQQGGPDPTELLRQAQQVDDHRSVEWAIEDLARLESDGVFDTPSTSSKLNKERIAHLFEHDLHELPDSERPDCHRDGNHSYKSVYGRMYWDRPAQTITTGFGSMGQGRFVHSTQQRTITPHEAARIQTFPDWFDWGEERRGYLAKMIGNAVPPLLTVRLGELLVPYLAS